MSSSSLGLGDDLRDYLIRVGVRENEHLAGLREATASHEWAVMQISPEQGAFMQMLVNILGAKRCIEIGTFTGYSALAVAQALPDDGYLLACDINDEFTRIGVPFWEQAGVRDKIDLQLAPAVETLQAKLGNGEAGTYDFAFIDADKPNYVHYYEACLELLRQGGVIAIDNVLWGGNVINPDDDEPSTIGIRAINEHVAADERVQISMIPVGDGLTLARKL